MRYRYIGESPSVLGGFSYGRNATVSRAAKDAPDDKPGSTVVVHPGDIIETPDTITSLVFEDLDPAAASPYAGMRKPELVALAGDRGLDTGGTVPELRERLDAFDAEQGSAGGSQENSGSDDGSGAGGILSPENGAQPLTGGDIVRLNEAGREAFPDADPDDIAEVQEVTSELVTLLWADGAASDIDPALIERVPNNDDGKPADAAHPDTEGAAS